LFLYLMAARSRCGKIIELSRGVKPKFKSSFLMAPVQIAVVQTSL